MSLTIRTLPAVGWTTFAKVSQQVLQFGLSIVLMRLLGPEAYGLIGMVLVFSGFASIFSELGFGSALVQRQDLREEHRSTVFWLIQATGMILAVLMFMAAPLIAGFYREPMLRSVASWVALSFVLSSPSIVPRALFQKSFRFDIIAKVDITALIVSGGVAAGVAALGGGVWSLVSQQLIGAAVSSALLLYFADWRPRLVWSQGALREMWGYSAGLTGFNFINYWARSADKLLIGKFFSPMALGLYARAYSIMLLPLNQIVSVLSPVMFPAFSTIQDDKPRVRRAFLRLLGLLTFITFPIMLGIIVEAESFVIGLFGAKWVEVIPLIQILAFCGLTQTICNPTGWIYTSQGRTDWMFWWGVGGAGFLILSIVAGILVGGIKNVAIAYLIGNIIITVPCVYFPGLLIGMSVKDVWLAIRGNLACALAMAALLWGTGFLLPAVLPPLARLAIQASLGVLAFGAFSYVSHQPALKEIAEMSRHILYRQASTSI